MTCFDAPLIGSMAQPCTILRRIAVADGLGGENVTYADGERFEAALVLERVSTRDAAGQRAERRWFTVTTLPGVGLEFGERFRRETDGALFVVTESAFCTPPCAGFHFEQARAEQEVPMGGKGETA